MTYKLNPIIELIESPVKLIIPETGGQRTYGSGAEAAADVFNKNFAIGSIRAEGSSVVIVLVENSVPGNITWTGEQQENLFDG